MSVIHDAMMAARKALYDQDLPDAIRCIMIALEALEEKVEQLERRPNVWTGNP